MITGECIISHRYSPEGGDARSKYTKLCGALCGKFTKKLNKITQSGKDQHKSKIFYHTQTLFDVNATLAIVSTTNKLITKWNE